MAFIFNRFNSTIYPQTKTKQLFVLAVTDLFHYETVNNDSHSYNSSSFIPYSDYTKQGDDIEFTGDTGSNIKHSKTLKGIRLDRQENSLGNVLIPVKHSGHVPHVNIGDHALIQAVESPTKPIHIGAVHTKTSNWADALTFFERPVPPSLEMRGSSGEVTTYNPIYLTFHPNYQPSGRYFGEKEDQIWYDRFVLFESGDIYRNKKNLIDYSPWIKKTFEDKGDGGEHVLKLLEDPSNLQFMDKFFYLKEKNYPFRPDPIFDTTSNYHQSTEKGAVLYSKAGVDLGLEAITKSSLDKYPVTHTHLRLNDALLLKTAYDEVVNATLKEKREKSKLAYDEKFVLGNEKKFEPDLLNKSVPFEFKESREIRIGRNKLFIADVYGDEKQLFSTFKTAKDQGLTLLYHNDVAEISQVRLRGNLGESLLIESRAKSDNFSRINLKGVSGQIVEMFDNKDNENFIHFLTSDSDQMSQNWSLSKASYLSLANKQVISSEKRLTNNPVIDHYDNRSGPSGRYTVRGVYDGVHHAYSAQLLDSTKQAYTENWTHFNGSTWVHDVRRGLSGDANGFHRAQKGANYVQYTYSGNEQRFQIHNKDDSNVEIHKKNVIIRTSPSGKAEVWAPSGTVDVRGDSKVDVGSASVINLIAPVINIGSTNPPKLVVRDLDQCIVGISGSVTIPGLGVFPVDFGDISCYVDASEGSVYVTNGESVSSTKQAEYNLEGGGI